MSRVLAPILALLIFGCSSHQKGDFKRIKSNEVAHFKPKEGAEVYIRIFKMEKLLELWIRDGKKFRLYKTYNVVRESGRLGPKTKEGDRQNPEGVYKVYKHSLNPNSKYHLAIDIGYPNKFDRNLGRTGSYIMIHGSNKSIGCFAMGDKNIEEIYHFVKSALDHGQEFVYVTIFPFIMSDENMKKYDKYNYLRVFWKQMRNIYIIFNDEKIPPKVIVLENSYLVEKVQDD